MVYSIYSIGGTGYLCSFALLNRQEVRGEMKQRITKLIKKTSTSLLAAGLAFSLVTPFAPKAAAALAPAARVTFTFDDGLTSSLTDAAPTLAKYGFAGVNYVITGCAGTTGTCPADPDKAYMTWDQILTLQNTYGWEIGAHTKNHAYLASSDPETQPNILTPAQVQQELAGANADFAAHGITAPNFASPYGDWTPSVLQQISAHYQSHRGFADSIDQTGPAGVPDGIIDHGNTFPYNDKLLYDLQVQAGVSVDTVKSFIDQSIANNQWLILTFHGISPTASTNPDDYEYNTADLDAIAAYVKSKSVPVVTIAQGLATNPVNMFTNGSFDTALSSNIADTAVWSTDDPTNIKQHTGGKGSYPSATNSVQLNGTTKNIELFSPRVTVDSTKAYVIKSYLAVEKMTVASGHEISFYVDEYDANGTWLQTVFKKAEVGNAGSTVGAWTENMNFEYKPTSATVASARLQVVVTANSGALAYIDNVEMFAQDGSTTGGSGSAGKAGDVNGDLAVNALDLSIMLSHWNATGATRAFGDLNGDTKVNAVDLSILLTNWNK